MRGELDRIRAAGADLVFIGNGSLRAAAAFARSHAGGCRVLTDPSRHSYDALGMRRGVGRTLGPGSLAEGIGAALRGHMQTSVEGDPWQQGGLIVMAKGGRIFHSQCNEHAGDRPDLETALIALRSARFPGGT